MEGDKFWSDGIRMKGIERQEEKASKSSLTDPSVILPLVVGTVLALRGILSIPGRENMLPHSVSILPRLENHAKCGLTTGGKVSFTLTK